MRSDARSPLIERSVRHQQTASHTVLLPLPLAPRDDSTWLSPPMNFNPAAGENAISVSCRNDRKPVNCKPDRLICLIATMTPVHDLSDAHIAARPLPTDDDPGNGHQAHRWSRSTNSRRGGNRFPECDGGRTQSCDRSI